MPDTFKNKYFLEIQLVILCLSVGHFLYSQTNIKIAQPNNTINLTTYGHGEPILIINGGPGMNSKGFSGLAKTLGKANQTIIYDQRGTGDSHLSVKDNTTITLDLMLEDIEIIRHHFGFKNWIVFGHSFGGMLASYYASKYPNTVKALILSSSGGVDLRLFDNLSLQSRLSRTKRDFLNYWNNRIAQGDTTYHARLKRGEFLAPAYLHNKAFKDTIAKRLTQGNMNINRLVWQNMRVIKFNCAKQLKNFKSPVLIIHGQYDVVPKHVPEYAHKIFENSTLTYIENSSHYAWLENPKAYFGAINTFLKTHQFNK